MEKYFYATALILAVLAAAAVFQPPEGEEPLAGYTEVDDVDASGNFLVFEAGCHRLNMVVSAEQSRSILRGMLNATSERPLTHDLLASVISATGAELEAVKIHSLENGTYRAQIVLDGRERAVVDSRPSDATALAVRTGTPVYVRDRLLPEQGEDTCRRGGDTV